jgi:hypothetical protein
MKHISYKYFYKVEGVSVWRSHEFDAKNDLQAIQKVHEFERQVYDKIIAAGLERITTERIF